MHNGHNEPSFQIIYKLSLIIHKFLIHKFGPTQVPRPVMSQIGVSLKPPRVIRVVLWSPTTAGLRPAKASGVLAALQNGCLAKNTASYFPWKSDVALYCLIKHYWAWGSPPGFPQPSKGIKKSGGDSPNLSPADEALKAFWKREHLFCRVRRVGREIPYSEPCQSYMLPPTASKGLKKPFGYNWRTAPVICVCGQNPQV